MGGILKLAYKLLVNDRAKFVILPAAVGFSIFPDDHDVVDVCRRIEPASSTVINIGATIWVMDPAVNNVASCDRLVKLHVKSSP